MDGTRRFMSLSLALLLCVSFAVSLVMIPKGTEAFDLPDDATVEGWVTSGGSTPVADAYVKVMLMMGDGIQINYSFTDSSGYYNINLTGGYDYAVFVAHEDYYFAMTQTSIMTGETVQRDFDLEPISPIVASALMKGYVLDESDVPVTDGNVFGFVTEGSDGMPYYGRTTTVDSFGYFEVYVIPSTSGGGVFLMDLDGYGMIGNETSDAIEGGLTYWMNITVVEPVYDDDAHIYGYVTDAGTGLPINAVMISVDIWDEGAGEDYFNYTLTGADGFFEMNISSGSMDIQFQKSGYATYMEWETMVDPGADLDLSVEMVRAVATIRGNVTDGVSGDPLPYGTVILYNAPYVATGMTNESGYYEINAFEGTDLTLFTEFEGYSRGMDVVDVAQDDILWVDFELYPVDAWLTGHVTDMITGDPIEDGYVYVQSDNYEDWSNTDSTGYYNVSLVSGSYYVQIGANNYMSNESTVEVLPDAETVHDVELLPWDIPSTTDLHGWVNDSTSNEGIPYAEICVYLEDSWYSSRTTANETGYYEMMIAPIELSVYAYANDHAPYFDSVDATGLSELELNILLDADGYSPNGSGSMSPTENVTWDNPEWLHFEVQDYYMRSIQLLMFMNYSTYETGTEYNLVKMWGMSNDPLNSYSTLPYSQVDDQYTVDVWWNASADGGWLSGEMEDDMYLGYNMVNYYGTDYYALSGFYTNSTVSMESGYAMFDIPSGDYAMFVFGNWTSTEPGDVSGTFSPYGNVLVLDWDLGFSTMNNGPVLGDWSVDGLRYVYDYLVPSTTYAVLFMANDWGGNGWGNLSFTMVDNDLPVADSGGDISVVVNTTFTLDASGSSDNVGIVSYLWEFEDSEGVPQTYTDESFEYMFDKPGTYPASLTVTDGAGHEDVDMFVITVTPDGVPIANAGADFDAVEDLPAIFDGTGSSDDVDVVNYTWTISSLSVTMYGAEPEYTFADPGSYSVQLIVNDTIGQISAPDTVIVTVEDVTDPVAVAGINQTISLGTEITFNGSGSSDNSGSIESYIWTFDDGEPIILANVTVDYTFTTAGVHEVTLTVIDGAGLSANDTIWITVEDDEDPVADAGPNQTVSLGDEVTLDGSDSTDNSGVIVSYVWTFDDDGPKELTGMTVDYEFTELGVYIVTLTVEDGAGLTDTDTVTISVVDGEAPVADAGPDPTGVLVGDTVILNGSESTDNIGIVSYVWTFTDETAQELTGETVTYTFDNEGIFEITLTVTDEAGFEDTDIVIVRVSSPNEAPVADAGLNQNVKVGQTVTLDASGSSDDNAIVTYTWTFEYDGEQVTLTGVEQEFVFDIEGTYIITLNVTDGQGEWDTDTVTIVVEESAISFITDYWWAFAVLAAAVVIGIAAALMGKGKGGKGKSSPPSEDEIADELEDDDLPPPDDDL